MTRIALPPVIDPRAFVGLDPAAPVVALGGETMGTTWRVLAVRPPADVADAIRRRLAGLVAEMSHWEPRSLLSRFNRAPGGGWHALPPDFAHVVQAAIEVARLTDGAFDPAIGRMVDVGGHGPPGADPPADPQAHARSGYRRLDWDAAARRLFQPGGVHLDLSGIAKGYAVDAIADLLARCGVAHALVEVGGELVGRGVQPSGEPWWVDLETPPGAPAAPLRVALHGLAVATSGDYVKGAHTIDPGTGMPAATYRAVSVLHAEAMIADAWATALTVLGRDAPAVAARHGIAARLVSRDGEALTPALAAMIEDQPSATA